MYESYELTLLIFGGMFLVFILLGLRLGMKGLNETDDNLRFIKERERLQEAIRREQERLINLENINTDDGLPVIVSQVLDKYDQAGIKIQADILEELTYNTFTDEQEVITFIEQNRKNWRHENMKKL